MGSPLLAQQYAETLRIGRQLLKVLEEPLTDETLGQIEVLLANRGEIAMHTAQMVDQGDLTADTQGDLQQVVAQQRLLEEAFRRAADDLQQQVQGTHCVQDKLRVLRQMLKPGADARLIDECR